MTRETRHGLLAMLVILGLLTGCRDGIQLEEPGGVYAPYHAAILPHYPYHVDDPTMYEVLGVEYPRCTPDILPMIEEYSSISLWRGTVGPFRYAQLYEPGGCKLHLEIMIDVLPVDEGAPQLIYAAYWCEDDNWEEVDECMTLVTAYYSRLDE